MSKHTPGPWQVARGHRSGSARAVYPVLRFDSLMRQGHDFEANARLIAAAPELLDALQDALSALEVCGRDFDHATGKARAAIAKAMTS
jgi:hypothetical protein